MWWYSENHPINFKKLNFVFLHAGALAVILIVVFVKFDTIANGFAQKVKRNFQQKSAHLARYQYDLQIRKVKLHFFNSNKSNRIPPSFAITIIFTNL